MVQQFKCEEAFGQHNYHNSMLALDMDTGAIKSVYYDAYNFTAHAKFA